MVAALVAAITVGGCNAEPRFERPILMISGRDDHGLLLHETIGLLIGPDGAVKAEVPDGSLVQVVDEEAEWIEVELLEGPPARGWINDFFLRGTVHVVGDPPACPVPLVGEAGAEPFAELRASEQVELIDFHGDFVGVKPLQGSDLGLVPRDWIQELPGPRPQPGVDCADIELSPEAEPHRH